MNQVSRRDVLKGIGALAIAPSIVRPTGFRFVHLTDIHIFGDLSAPKGVAQCVQRVLDLSPRPDFILTGGDMVFDLLGASDHAATDQLRLLKEAFKPFEMPVHYTIGNHDLYGLSKRRGDPDYAKKFFEDNLQRKTYISFDHKGSHFVILDNIQASKTRQWYSEVDQAQIEWLRNDLAKVGQKPVVVCCHVPLFSDFGNVATRLMKRNRDTMLCSNALEVHSVLAKHNVKLVLQGHTHIVEHVVQGSIPYFTAGSVCGEWWKGPRLGTYKEGFTVVDVNLAGVQTTYLNYGWHSPFKAKDS
jgi:3',5'-cyclic-AMP phosphodiesterase